jgi:hypothetical protein
MTYQSEGLLWTRDQLVAENRNEDQEYSLKVKTAGA